MEDHQDTGVEKRFIISLVLTGVILVAEVAGGLWTGSLALLSDAAHVFMDIFALGLSFLALRLSSLPVDDRHSYGYHRFEVLAALANGLTLLVIALGIWWEAYQRWFQPQNIKSAEMLVIALIGLIVNLVVAFVLSRGGKEVTSKDLNLHSAFLHVIGDTISSVGVITAAGLIWITGAVWIDPLMSVLIGGLILVSSWRVLRVSLHILLEGTPEGISTKKVEGSIKAVEGVLAVHDLHIWNICSGHIALSAHVVVEDCVDQPGTMTLLKSSLMSGFAIEHTTVQFELEDCGQHKKMGEAGAGA